MVKVISESGGMANLDTDGDGDSDPADYPAALKLTDGERTTLAPLYAPATSCSASRSRTCRRGTTTGRTRTRPARDARGSARTAG